MHMSGFAGVVSAAFIASVGLANATECAVEINFATGSAALQSDVRAVLTRIAQLYPNASVHATGFTDAVGSAAANLVLSKRRVDAVSSLLESGSSGISIEEKWVGESQLKVARDGSELANRRVHVLVDNCDPEVLGGDETLASLEAPIEGLAPALAAGLLVVGLLAGGGGGSGTTTTTTTTTVTTTPTTTTTTTTPTTTTTTTTPTTTTTTTPTTTTTTTPSTTTTTTPSTTTTSSSGTS